MTNWNECTERITGNYLSADYRKKVFKEHKCSRRRVIAVIFKKFLSSHLLSCINQSLPKIGHKGEVDFFHLVHEGIYADPKHSPKSLHAENRAIDIRYIRLRRNHERELEVDYRKVSHRPFFKSLRRCWGRKLQKYNSCPLFRGSSSLTGSIGREDRLHKNHLHLSVPYCINGRYSDLFFQR